MSKIYRHVSGTTWANVPDGNKILYHNGSGWVNPREILYHNGSGWVKAWDGDTTAPSGGNINNISWNGTGFTVSYDAVSDLTGIASLTLYYGLNGGTMTAVNLHPGGTPTTIAAGSVNVAHKGRPTQSSPNTGFHYFYIAKADVVGNSINTGGSYQWAKPSGDWYFTPNNTLNNGYGTWRVDNSPDWRTGITTSIFGFGTYSQYAYGFYNTDFKGDRQTYSTGVTKGYTPDSGEVEIWDGTSDGTGGTFYISTHAYKSHPGTGTAPSTTVANSVETPLINYGYGAAISLPSGALSAMNSQSDWGLFLYHPSSYKVVSRPGDSGSYNGRTYYSWRVKISYT